MAGSSAASARPARRWSRTARSSRRGSSSTASIAGRAACSPRGWSSNGANGRNAVAVAEAAANICCPRGAPGVTAGPDADDRSHARSHPRRGAVEAPARAGQRQGRRSRAEPSLGRRAAVPVAGRCARRCRLGRFDRRSAHRRRQLRRRRAADFADPGDDPDRCRRLSAARRAGGARRGRSGAGDPPARHRRVDRHRPADRGKQGRAPVGGGGDRRGPAAAVRADRGQRLRLRPDRPPARPRLAGRAGAGPRRRSRPARCCGEQRSRGRARSGSSRIRPSSRCWRRKPDWLDALARQIGGAVGLRADPALPMSGGYAEQA